MQALEFPFSTPPSRGELMDIAPDIKWLRMPLPYALDHINLYLVRDGHGWLIIDSGFDNDVTREVWRQIFDRLPADEPITGVLCTHSHGDHAGAAGWLTHTLRVPLHMSMGEYFWLRGLASANGMNSWEFDRFYQQLGFSKPQRETMLTALGKMRLTDSPPQSYRRLQEQTQLTLAGDPWRVITGSGHSPEHVSLFCEPRKILICGDQLLPSISANVSVSAVEPECDPLRTWMDSLRRVGELPADTLVLPAHGLPYRGLRARAAELLAHHRQQLQHLQSLCATQTATVFELAAQLFPRRRGPLDDFLASGECLAHLNYLHTEGRVRREQQDDGVYRFSAR